MIVDGMDKRKCKIPSFELSGSKKQRDATEGGLKQTLVGVKVHGVGNFCYLFHPNTKNGGGSNMTIEVLRRVLLAIDSASDNMPRLLNLQLDNCGGENKNKFVFAFLAYLVQAGIFQEIHLSFLIVGHTHEDIDQMFSTISKWLTRKEVVTPQEWIEALRLSFRNQDHKPYIQTGEGVNNCCCCVVFFIKCVL